MWWGGRFLPWSRTSRNHRGSRFEQAAKLEFVHTGFFTTDAAEELAAIMAEQSPGSLDRVWFTGSGSEAIEAALKLARQYHLERGDPGRTRVIARRQSYHGNTLGALAAGGSAWRRAPYEPLLIDVALVDPCFEYRFAEPGESSADYGRRAADAVERGDPPTGPGHGHGLRCRNRRGRDGRGGSAGGAIISSASARFASVMACLLILDEVMCGSGPDRDVPVVRAGRCRPRHRHLGKGLGRWLSADRRGDLHHRSLRQRRARIGRAKAWPDLQRASGWLRCCARGPAK